MTDRLEILKKLLIISLLISHAGGSLCLLTPTELLNDEPIYTGDYPAFFYRCIVMSEFMSRAGEVGGYDPYLRAGYRYPLAMNDGERVMQVLVYMLSPLPKVTVFKFYIFFVMLLIPLFVYMAARNFELSRNESIVLLVLVLFLWWAPISISFSLLFYGLTNFVLASYLSTYIASLFYQLLIKKNTKQTLPLAFLLPLVFFVHIEAPLILAAPILTAYIYSFRRLSKKMHMIVWLLILLPLPVNAFWLVPELREFFLNPHIGVASDLELPKYHFQPNLIEHLKLFLKVLPGVLLALLAFRKYREARQLPKFYIFLTTFFALFVLTYFGSASYLISLMQPVRFKLPMIMFLLFPLSMGIYYLLESIVYPRVKPLALPACLLILLLPVALPQILSHTSADGYLNARIPPEGKQLLDWIQQNTSNDARVLLESADQSIFNTPYYFGHLPVLLPYLTKREFISTAWPLVDFSTFSNGVLFAEDVRKFSLEELKKYFHLYNVKWVICWSQDAIEAFTKHPEYIPFVEKVDRFYIFTVQQDTSFYLRGYGRVRADYNVLQLDQVKPEDGSVVIKYHWMDSLKTDPPRVINRIEVASDPYGFIEILNPPESLKIYYTYAK